MQPCRVRHSTPRRGAGRRRGRPPMRRAAAALRWMTRTTPSLGPARRGGAAGPSPHCDWAGPAYPVCRPASPPPLRLLDQVSFRPGLGGPSRRHGRSLWPGKRSPCPVPHSPAGRWRSRNRAQTTPESRNLVARSETPSCSSRLSVFNKRANTCSAPAAKSARRAAAAESTSARIRLVRSSGGAGLSRGSARSRPWGRTR